MTDDKKETEKSGGASVTDLPAALPLPTCCDNIIMDNRLPSLKKMGVLAALCLLYGSPDAQCVSIISV